MSAGDGHQKKMRSEDERDNFMDKFYEQEMPELTHTTIEIEDEEPETQAINVGARKRRREMKKDP